MSKPVDKVLSLSNASSGDRRRASAQAAMWAFRKHDADCGSSRVQIARLTVEIDALKLHLAKHKKDFSCKYGLRSKLGKREKHLKYLLRTDPADYAATVRALNLKNKIATK